MRIKIHRRSNQLLAMIECRRRDCGEKFSYDLSVEAARTDGAWGDACIVVGFQLVFPEDVQGYVKGFRKAAEIARRFNRETKVIERRRLVWSAKAGRHVPRRK